MDSSILVCMNEDRAMINVDHPETLFIFDDGALIAAAM